MNLELDLYPIISNKIIRQKDWKSIKEHKPGFWSKKDIEGNRLVRTQRGYFLNNKNISVTSAQSFILSHGIQDVSQNIFQHHVKITKNCETEQIYHITDSWDLSFIPENRDTDQKLVSQIMNAMRQNEYIFPIYITESGVVIDR